MRVEPGAGAVRVRPMRLSDAPHLNRYQYCVSGASPAGSACTVNASWGIANAAPRRTMRRKSASAATS